MSSSEERQSELDKLLVMAFSYGRLKHICYEVLRILHGLNF